MGDDDEAHQPVCLWQLPADALALVASHLSVRDLLSLRAACRPWRLAVELDALWQPAFAARWPALLYEVAACGSRWRDEFRRRAVAVAGASFLDPSLRAWDANDGAAPPAAAISHVALCAPLAVDAPPFTPASAVPALLFAAQSARLYSVPARPAAATLPLPLRAHTGRISCLETDGETIITASFDRTVRLWPGISLAHQAATSRGRGIGAPGVPIRGLCADAAAIMALSPIRSSAVGAPPLMASGAADGLVRVATLTAASAQRAAVLRGHGSRVTALAWADGGGGANTAAFAAAAGPTPGLLSAAADGRVKLWDASAGACLATWQPMKGGGASIMLTHLLVPPVSACSGAHGAWFALGPRRLAMLDFRVGGGGVASTAFSADVASAALAGAAAPHCVVTGHADGVARVWDARKLPRQQGATRQHGGEAAAVASLRGHAGPVTAIVTDGHKLLTGVRAPGDSSSRASSSRRSDQLAPATLRVWCAATHAPRAALPLCGTAAALPPSCAAACAAGEASCSGGCLCGVTALATRGGLIAAGTPHGTLLLRDYEEALLPRADARDVADEDDDDSETTFDDGNAEGRDAGGRFWLRALASRV